MEEDEAKILPGQATSQIEEQTHAGAVDESNMREIHETMISSRPSPDRGIAFDKGLGENFRRSNSLPGAFLQVDGSLCRRSATGPAPLQVPELLQNGDANLPRSD